MIARILRRLRKQEWRYALGALVLAGSLMLGALGYWWYVTPTRMSVAIGPWDSAEGKLIEAYAAALTEQAKDIRLKVVRYKDVRQSAQALQDKAVDLAIVRPDVFLPDNGLTVAILREEGVIVAAPGSEIKEMAGLAQKRLAVVARHAADLPAIQAVLAHYALSPPNLTLSSIVVEELDAAIRAKRIDAVTFVAAPAGPEAAAVIRVVEQASGSTVTIVPVEQSEALALKTPALTELKIPPGTLSGRPKLPKEEVKTVAVSYRLMTRATLDRGAVSKLTQYLFQMRSRIAQEATSINLLSAPESEKATSAALPNHPGAFDYYNREQLTFMDRYGDWVWLILLFGGSLTSGVAWLAQLFVRKRRELVDEVIDRLMCVLSKTREARTLTDLDELATEVDTLVTHAVRYARYRTTNTRTMSALILSIDSARAAMIDRRRDLLEATAGRSFDAAQCRPRCYPHQLKKSELTWMLYRSALGGDS